MIPDPMPPPPNPGAPDANGGEGTHHRQLLQATHAALAGSPAHALLDCARTIHRTLLASDARALRRSVGWWGRLLGRDIAVQEESKTLRKQLGVHVVQARRQLEALTHSDRELQALGVALRAEIEALKQQADAMRTRDSAEVVRRHLHVATLAASLQTTASHVDLTLLNHRELGQRVQQMLPHVELLLDQQRMLLAGLDEPAALQFATRSMGDLHGLECPPLSGSTAGASAPDTTASKRTTS